MGLHSEDGSHVLLLL
jgi:hypothetical protein